MHQLAIRCMQVRADEHLTMYGVKPFVTPRSNPAWSPRDWTADPSFPTTPPCPADSLSSRSPSLIGIGAEMPPPPVTVYVGLHCSEWSISPVVPPLVVIDDDGAGHEPHLPSESTATHRAPSSVSSIIPTRLLPSRSQPQTIHMKLPPVISPSEAHCAL